MATTPLTVISDLESGSVLAACSGVAAGGQAALAALVGDGLHLATGDDDDIELPAEWLEAVAVTYTDVESVILDASGFAVVRSGTGATQQVTIEPVSDEVVLNTSVSPLKVKVPPEFQPRMAFLIVKKGNNAPRRHQKQIPPGAIEVEFNVSLPASGYVAIALVGKLRPAMKVK